MYGKIIGSGRSQCNSHTCCLGKNKASFLANLPGTEANLSNRGVFKTLFLLKRVEQVANEKLADSNRLSVTFTRMLHDLLICSIKTFYDCVTIYLSISDNLDRLPWGFSHSQPLPLWHTLLSLFKYPVTSDFWSDTHRHVIKSSISPRPGLPSCACGDGLIFSSRDPQQEVVFRTGGSI